MKSPTKFDQFNLRAYEVERRNGNTHLHHQSEKEYDGDERQPRFGFGNRNNNI